MKYEVKKKNIYFTVGRYRLDNKQDAEHLCQTLNKLTEASTTNNDTDKKLDTIQKKIIQLQLTAGILTEELEALHKELL